MSASPLAPGKMDDWKNRPKWLRPRLDREQERELTQKARFDQTSMEELIQANVGFVISIALEYRLMGPPFEDLISAGNLGLIEAARRFDGERGNRFITYAVWWIRKSILSAIEAQGPLVRLPRYQRKLARKRQSSRPDSIGLVDPTASPLDAQEQHLSSAASISRRAIEISIDQPRSAEDERTLADRLTDPRFLDGEGTLLRGEAEKLVNSGLALLDERERTILSWRFGIGTGEALTFGEIGTKLGLSRERVRQLECLALGRLRRWLGRRTAPPQTRTPTAVEKCRG